MIAAVIAFFLLQGIPIQQGGTVSGILRDSSGAPVTGVRMAAVMRPDSLAEIAEGTASIYAETDSEGKYSLESIPPGRYVIAAGRLDLQTFYPGTQEIENATVVSVIPGAKLANINFAMSGTSAGRAGNGRVGNINAIVPLSVAVEGGGKIPVTANGRFISIRLDSAANPISVPIDAANVSIPGPTTMNFQVMVEGLPEDYLIKSITYGSTDVTNGTFRMTPSNFQTVTTGLVPSSLAPPTISPGMPIAEIEAQLRSFLAAINAGTQVTNAVSPPSTLSITLRRAQQSENLGVRVSGRLTVPGKSLVYISGRSGIVYADGTFEFRDVTPGRHIAAMTGNPPRAAVVVVGDEEVKDVELKETILLPSDIRTPHDPLPAGNYAPGATVPLARVRGIVREETSKEPIREGDVVLKAGDTFRTIPIQEDGHFESFTLLPGTYEMRFQIFAHSTIGPTFTVEDKDIELELTTRRLY